MAPARVNCVPTDQGGASAQAAARFPQPPPSAGRPDSGGREFAHSPNPSRGGEGTLGLMHPDRLLAVDNSITTRRRLLRPAANSRQIGRHKREL